MIANAHVAAITILREFGFWLIGELKLLIPYRSVLRRQYADAILADTTIVFVNVFAAVYAIQRKLFLKDTGRKLSHIDKQLVAGIRPCHRRQPRRPPKMSRDFTPRDLEDIREGIVYPQSARRDNARIDASGGENLRVMLDFELKKKLGTSPPLALNPGSKSLPATDCGS